MKFVEDERATICVHAVETARDKKRRVEMQKEEEEMVADHVEVGDGAESGPEH